MPENQSDRLFGGEAGSDWKEPGKISRVVSPPAIDWEWLTGYRLGRLRAALVRHDIAAAVISNPQSIRYAVEFHEFAILQSRRPSASLIVFADGPAILAGAYHETAVGVDEYIPGFCMNPMDGGLDLFDRARQFADFMRERSTRAGTAGRSRLAVDRLESSAVFALVQIGFEVVDASVVIEEAKTIKSAEEIELLRYAVNVAEIGIARMRAAMIPGIREIELWSVLAQTNLAHGGQWHEGRMLSSGPRTNPWIQEACDRPIENGDLVAFDTDMTGPFGYAADMSRTWLCGDGEPSAAQKDVYKRAYEEICHNMALIVPGLTYREMSERCFRQPEEFVSRHYPCVAHGVGMANEYPRIPYPYDWERIGYDGVIEEGMVLCVESYVGSDRGGEGVKLERQGIVSGAGFEPIDSYPFENEFLH